MTGFPRCDDGSTCKCCRYMTQSEAQRFWLTLTVFLTIDAGLVILILRLLK